MPQISIVGAGGNYAGIEAWVAAEKEIDYGAGNPAIAEITGTVAPGGLSGTWPRGFIIKAAAGEEPVFSGGSGTAVVSGLMVYAQTGALTNSEINNITVSGLDIRTSNSSIVTTFNNCLINGLVFARDANATVRANNCLSVTPLRAYDATSGADAVATNCTVIQTGSQFAYVRWLTTACVKFAGGTGWAATIAGSDYNASNDTSSPGANSLDNITSAEFVDYAAGDYRAATGSQLATGYLGLPIGFAVDTAVPVGDQIPLPLLTNTQTFYPLSVSASAEIALPALLNTQSFYPLTVNAQADIQLPFLSNAQSFPALTISVGNVSVALPFLQNEQAFYPLTVAGSGSSVDLPLLINTQTFYPLGVDIGPVSVGLPFLSNSQTFYPLTVLSGAAVDLPLLVNNQTFYPLTVTAEAAIALPQLVNNQEFYPLSIVSGSSVDLPLLVNEQAFYPLGVEIGPVSVALPFLLNEQVFPAITIRNYSSDPLPVGIYDTYSMWQPRKLIAIWTK